MMPTYHSDANAGKDSYLAPSWAGLCSYQHGPAPPLFGSCCVWLGGASVTSASRRAVILMYASLSSSSLALHPFTGLGRFMTDRHGDYRAALKAISIMLTLWSALCWVLYH